MQKIIISAQNVYVRITDFASENTWLAANTAFTACVFQFTFLVHQTRKVN